jgi:hypothetical protein
VHVQAESVVAPRHVLQALLDAAVVLGVDDRLLAIISPGVGAGRRQRRFVPARQAEEALTALALTGQGIGKRGAGAGDDLDLRGDQLARDRLGQQLVVLDRAVSQLLKAWGQLERRGIEDRELLLQADRKVPGLCERLDCLVEVEAGHVG